MKTDPKKYEYDRQYAKDKLVQVKFSLNKETDQDMIEWLGKMDNKQGYLKALIRNDMEGERKMKKFEKITSELYGAKKAGYTFDESADREMNEQLIRKLIAERGQKFVDKKLDAFYDLDGDLYKDEDGQAYAVEMVDGEPICWQKLRKAE